jgi:hypothetical protein
MSKGLPMGFLVHICTYFKMKFASVTSGATQRFKIDKKKTAYNVLLKTFKELGKLNSMTMSEAVKISTKFALAFLKNKTETINILNQLRYKLTTTSNKSAKKLPPTDDAFGQHVLRY